MAFQRCSFEGGRGKISCSPKYLVDVVANFFENVYLRLQGKTAEEVPLPGKIASQIREMLLAIYPTSAKEIDDENYSFLLDLAREYMIEKLTEKCEDFLIHKLRWPRQQHSSQCLDLLVTAQSYNLERLQEECIKNAGNLSRQELNSHSKRDEILFPNYRKLVDGIMERMENKIMELQRPSSVFKLY